MLLTRKKTVLAKLESVYGTDASPDGATNAMLVKNLNINPIQSELVSRDLIRPYLGNSEQLLATVFVQMDFEVEAVGAGFAGVVPAYGPLLKACGLAETVTTEAITSITRTGTTATATKNGHGYVVGDKIKISGATESQYNGNVTVIARTTNTFDYTVSGSPTTPATGLPVVHTKVSYIPKSESFDSVTLYYNIDGVLHKITGARGTVDLSFSVKQIPVFKFQFTGLYNAPTDTAAPSVDFSNFQVPQIANTQNTPGFSLFGYSAILESANFNLANDIQYITLIGRESVNLLDRAPAGSFLFEAPTIAEKDFFTIAKETQLGAMSITHGSRAGLKVKVSAPKVNLGNPSYQDSNGVQMLNVPYTANPDAGNDELVIDIM